MERNGNARTEIRDLPTGREIDVLVHGLLSPRQTAFALGISVGTVKNHRLHIVDKFQAFTHRRIKNFNVAVEVALDEKIITAKQLVVAFHRYVMTIAHMMESAGTKVQ